MVPDCFSLLSRYKLLLEGLLKCTKPTHPDFSKLNGVYMYKNHPCLCWNCLGNGLYSYSLVGSHGGSAMRLLYSSVPHSMGSPSISSFPPLPLPLPPPPPAASAQVAAVASHINEAIRQHESFRRMLSIQNRLTGQCVPGILAPGRQYIREGRVMKVGLHAPWGGRVAVPIPRYQCRYIKPSGRSKHIYMYM